MFLFGSLNRTSANQIGPRQRRSRIAAITNPAAKINPIQGSGVVKNLAGVSWNSEAIEIV
ncbi:MAG: hypothetical protein DME59_06595 [Verrucomicrobia bacterium]|nr:MAG: hypothetical protein DME59_06595 [Verrucomicrobiota bacterium]